MTLREVGENLGLTRERVRQLESQALQKLMSALREIERAGGKLGPLFTRGTDAAKTPIPHRAGFFRNRAASRS